MEKIDLQFFFFTDSRSLHNVKLSFDAVPGGLALQGTLQLPGVTVASGSIGSNTVAEQESGVPVITEIMYASNHSECHFSRADGYTSRPVM
jgi:hypothetical protein